VPSPRSCATCSASARNAPIIHIANAICIVTSAIGHGATIARMLRRSMLCAPKTRIADCCDEGANGETS